MIEYDILIVNDKDSDDGAKHIRVKEAVRNANDNVLVRYIAARNRTIPEQTVRDVLENFFDAALDLMSMGFAVPIKSRGKTVMRLYPDVFIDGGNINMDRARALIPGTSDITPDNATALVDKAGVCAAPRVKCTRSFFRIMKERKIDFSARRIITKDGFVPAFPVSAGNDKNDETVKPN